MIHNKGQRPVVIVDYDCSWPRSYGDLAAFLAAPLGRLALRIEHVGSTAVPALAAKPIIDLVVVIRTRDDLDNVAGILRGLGYEHQGDKGISGREAFRRTSASIPAHHLYVCAQDNDNLHRMVGLRDVLRRTPAVAVAYGDLKRSLAARYGRDRVGYTEAKTAFVRQTLDGSLS